MSEITSLSWNDPRVFLQRETIRSQDIDGYGHTNNGAYVQLCERAAWAHSESLGLGIDTYRELDRAMVISQANYDYLAPSYLDQQLTVATWLVRCQGRLHMERRFLLQRENDQKTIVRGYWRFVCTQMSSGKPCRMPPAFTAGYEPATLEPDTEVLPSA